MMLTNANIDGMLTAIHHGYDRPICDRIQVGLRVETLEPPPTIVLCFVLAIVVGYFAGRTVEIRNRIRSDREK
jgi:hypothetical protein